MFVSITMKLIGCYFVFVIVVLIQYIMANVFTIIDYKYIRYDDDDCPESK